MSISRVYDDQIVVIKWSLIGKIPILFFFSFDLSDFVVIGIEVFINVKGYLLFSFCYLNNRCSYNAVILFQWIVSLKATAWIPILQFSFSVCSFSICCLPVGVLAWNNYFEVQTPSVNTMRYDVISFFLFLVCIKNREQGASGWRTSLLSVSMRTRCHMYKRHS